MWKTVYSLHRFKTIVLTKKNWNKLIDWYFLDIKMMFYSQIDKVNVP